MKVKDFCIQHDLSENARYYWLRKNRAAAINRGRLCDLLLFFAQNLVENNYISIACTVFVPLISVQMVYEPLQCSEQAFEKHEWRC